MEWFLPITILPAVGLLIMSTTNQMLSLSNEIKSLLDVKNNDFSHMISDLKIDQLDRLTKSVTLLYISAAFFVTSGLVGATAEGGTLSSSSRVILIVGVILVLAALVILIRYGYKTIRIRRMQHAHNHETGGHGHKH